MHTLAPDAPFYIVMNAASGRGTASEARLQIERVLSGAQRRHEFFFANAPGQLPDLAKRAVEAAVRDNGAVIAAGGDGTINTVAQAALPAQRPFGIVPQGTFNYVSRTHGIPLDPEDAARALVGATIRPMQVGRVNERVFLVNASIGLYPQLFQDREHYKKLYGRKRTVAVWSALRTITRGARTLFLQLERDGEREQVLALTLFVGNNPLQLEQVGLPEAEAVEQRRLAGVIVPPVSAATLLGLALSGALGRLGESETVRNFAFRSLTVHPLRRVGSRGLKVAYDGEVQRMRPPLQFSVAPQPLMLLVPAAEPEADGQNSA